MVAAASSTLLDFLAIGALGLGLVCAALFALDRPNGDSTPRAWLLAAGYGGLLWLLFYLGERHAAAGPNSIALALALPNCGVACAVQPGISGILSLGLALVLAFAIGVAFSRVTGRAQATRLQSPGALGAGAASIVAWQVGMFAFMALAQLGWLMRFAMVT
jgi:hypothetical protein